MILSRLRPSAATANRTVKALNKSSYQVTSVAPVGARPQPTPSRQINVKALDQFPEESDSEPTKDTSSMTGPKQYECFPAHIRCAHGPLGQGRLAQARINL